MKLYFAVANVAFDAFIACWESQALLRLLAAVDADPPLLQGQEVSGWLGPCKGFVELPAEKWHPYSPATFVTPPFPGYVSGHSA